VIDTNFRGQMLKESGLRWWDIKSYMHLCIKIVYIHIHL